MVSQKLHVTLFTAYMVSTISLNIGLGAYSPALVVGDGETSFSGSPERASEVLQTLATGAENGAVPLGQAAPRPEGQKGAEIVPQALAVSSIPVSTVTPLAATTTVRPESRAQQRPSARRSLRVLAAAVTRTRAPSPQTPPAQCPRSSSATNSAARLTHVQVFEHGQIQVQDQARRLLLPAAGLEERETEIDAVSARIKRDIDGFRVALNFAREAQKDTPRAELRFGVSKAPGDQRHGQRRG